MNWKMWPFRDEGNEPNRLAFSDGGWILELRRYSKDRTPLRYIVSLTHPSTDEHICETYFSEWAEAYDLFLEIAQ